MRKEIIELLVKSGHLTKEQGEYIANAPEQQIKPGHLYTYNSAQLAIYFATIEVEKLGADIELTFALCDLQNSLNRLTIYLAGTVEA